MSVQLPDYNLFSKESLIKELTRCKLLLQKYQENPETMHCVLCDTINENEGDISECMSCKRAVCNEEGKCKTILCKRRCYDDGCEISPPARLCEICAKDKSIKQTYMQRNICYKCRGL